MRSVEFEVSRRFSFSREPKGERAFLSRLDFISRRDSTVFDPEAQTRTELVEVSPNRLSCTRSAAVPSIGGGVAGRYFHILCDACAQVSPLSMGQVLLVSTTSKGILETSVAGTL
jgi:hypothetical protein